MGTEIKFAGINLEEKVLKYLDDVIILFQADRQSLSARRIHFYELPQAKDTIKLKNCKLFSIFLNNFGYARINRLKMNEYTSETQKKRCHQSTNLNCICFLGYVM